MITKFLTLTLFASLLFTGCNKKDENTSSKESRAKTETKEPTEQTQTASNIIQLHTTDNKTISLTALENGINFNDYPNKVVLLDFFATWCPPCKAEIPHLVDIQNAYGDKVQIIGVLMEETKTNDELEAFKEQYGMNFPITNSPENFMLSNALGGIKSLPTMVMYDTHGEYFIHYVGAAPQEMIEADIKKALAK